MNADFSKKSKTINRDQRLIKVHFNEKSMKVDFYTKSTIDFSSKSTKITVILKNHGKWFLLKIHKDQKFTKINFH